MTRPSFRITHQEDARSEPHRRELTHPKTESFVVEAADLPSALHGVRTRIGTRSRLVGVVELPPAGAEAMFNLINVYSTNPGDIHEPGNVTAQAFTSKQKALDALRERMNDVGIDHSDVPDEDLCEHFSQEFLEPTNGFVTLLRLTGEGGEDLPHSEDV